MTTYKTENLIGGEIKTDQVKVLADTYYRGMPLKYNSATDRYEYSATAGEMAAVWLEETRIIATSDLRGSVIVGGEINAAGIVDDSGDALTITDAMISLAEPDGFYIKR